MNYFTVFTIGFLGLLALGGGISIAYRKKRLRLGYKAKRNWVIGAVTGVSAAAIFIVFNMIFGGFGHDLLDQDQGYLALRIVCFILQVALPLAGIILSLVAYVRQHACFRYFLSLWFNLIFLLLGLYTLGFGPIFNLFI